MQKTIAFVMLMNPQIALSEIYRCEALGIDRAATINVQKIDGKLSSLLVQLEAASGSLAPRDVSMLYINGVFVGGFVLGPQAEAESGVIGQMHLQHQEHLPPIAEGTTARLSGVSCQFKLVRSIIEEAASAPLLLEDE